MNHSDLDAALKAAKVPEGSAAYWDDIKFQVRTQLRRESASAPLMPRRSYRLAWGFALAAVCFALGLATAHWRTPSVAEDSLANVKLIRETLALFPNRVRAIVQDEHGLNLVLSDSADVPTSTPIYVRICEGKQCSSLVTFSGQEIQIAGQKLTVLSQPDGGIILEGPKFVWSSSEPVYAGRKLKIEAKNLGTITM